MLEAESWIYLDLEKTGCSFLRGTLQKLYTPQSFLETKKHSLQIQASKKQKILTIRDPHRYYFSLWSYGLDKKGGLYKKLAAADPKNIELMFGSKSKECFAWFLDFALNTCTRYSPTNTIGWLPKSCDLYTARILSMLIPTNERNIFLQDTHSLTATSNALLKTCITYFPEVILRTESLNQDFHRLADMGALNFMDLPAHWKSIFPIEAEPTNRSILSSQIKQGSKDLERYFTEESRQAIETKTFICRELINKAEQQLSRPIIASQTRRELNAEIAGPGTSPYNPHRNPIQE